jgi:hypothetical protein
MPRPAPLGPRAVKIIGHRYPNSFGWIVKVGSAIDRARLALMIDDDIRVEALRRAFPRIDDDNAVYYLPDRNQRRLVAVTRKAVRTGRANWDSRMPKSAECIAAEAKYIRCLIEVVGERLRQDQVTPVEATS